MRTYRVVSDDFSDHGLPIGAVVTPCDGPEWSDDKSFDSVSWFTQGGLEDETAIDERDLVVMIELDLTDRDLDLIEVALESAAGVCGSTFGAGGEDDLQKEYLTALTRVQKARR